MRRNIGASLRRELDKQESAEALLVFIEIKDEDHPDDVVRVVSESKSYIWQGEEWVGFWFDAVLLSDTEQAPEAQLAVQNVDQKIGQAIRQARRPPRLNMYVIPASEFDEDQDPRVARGMAESPQTDAIPSYSAKHLYLIETEQDVAQVRGQIASWNYAQRMWGRKVTKADFPAIFAGM